MAISMSQIINDNINMTQKGVVDGSVVNICPLLETKLVKKWYRTFLSDSSKIFIHDETIYIGAMNGDLNILDLHSLALITTYNVHSGGVCNVSLDYSSGFNYLISGGYVDNKVILSNPANGTKEWEFTGHTSSITRVYFDNETRHTYSSSWDGTIRKISPSGREVFKFQLGSKVIDFVKYKNIIVAATENSVVYLDLLNNTEILKKNIGGIGNVVVKNNNVYLGHNSTTKGVTKLDLQGNIIFNKKYTSRINALSYGIIIDNFERVYMITHSGKVLKINPANGRLESILSLESETKLFCGEVVNNNLICFMQEGIGIVNYNIILEQKGYELF